MSSIEQKNDKWLYIFKYRNENIIKIGVTKDVNQRLKQANSSSSSDAFKLPDCFSFLIAINLKKLAFKIENGIKYMFKKQRIKETEFYEYTEEIMQYFDILKGDRWRFEDKKETKYDKLSNLVNVDSKFRHVCWGDTAYFKYNPQNNTVIYNGIIYKGSNGSPLNELILARYKEIGNGRNTGNAWDDCEIQINDNQWISLNKFISIN